MPSQTVLLAGATGMLGARIAHHLLETEDVGLKLLVRPMALRDPSKRSVLDPLAERGAELVDGDVGDRASLDRATRGIDVVISALQGGREVIVDGQVALARAASANGVRRMLPSDYALDLFKTPPGEHPPFDERRKADEAIAALGIEHVHVLTGAFLDLVAMPGAIVQFDDDAGVATLWGSGEERFEATSVEDTARYVARVALDPAVPSGKFAVAAQRVSLGDVVSLVERTHGRQYVRRSLGTAEELRTHIAAQRKAGDEMGATMNTYLLYMLTGQASLDHLQNERYSDIRPTTLEQQPAAGVRA